MKKILLTTLCCLLLCALAAPALANGYGLKGGIYDIVTTSDRYDGYTCPNSDADDGNRWLNGRHVNHAILENRYHRVLIAAWRDGSVWKAETASTTALYQPGDERGEYPNIPSLSHWDNGFTLRYGEQEMYRFVYDEDLGEYVLFNVRYDIESAYSDSYVTSAEGFQFWQSGEEDTFTPIGDALWQTDGITLAEFNITQTPRSLAEIRRLNTVRSLLDCNALPLVVQTEFTGAKEGEKLAVYSAPDDASYRSASGKAVVSTADAFQIWGQENGWTLISYEVSPRTSRMGYVQAEYAGASNLAFAEQPVVTAVDTFLTDDPFVSQYAQAYIPAGTALTGLARCGEYYAYVSGEKDGQPIRGFVPMKDLQPLYDTVLSATEEILYADAAWDVMDALIGKWTPEGGEADWGRLILMDGGSFRNHMSGDGSVMRAEGNFRVTRGENDVYNVVFITEDNTRTLCRMTLNSDGTITLISDDGQTVLHRWEYSTYGNG